MLKHLAILSGVFAAFYFLARGTAWQGPYVYDEADCMYAVSLGWRANWMDSPTLSLPEFARLGLGSRASSKRADLSETIRNSNDVLFYRHWHGAAYADWLRLLRPFALDERSTRAAGIVFPIAVAILLYFGLLWLMPGSPGEIAAIVAAILYLWSFPVVRTTELAPHQLFAFTVVAALLLLSKALQGGPSARSYWYGALVATGVAFCVLEVAFALILTLLICGHLDRSRLRPDLPFLGKSIAAFLAPVLIIWPAAIFKLSFAKAFLFMAYLAVFRKGSWGNDIGIGQTWWLRFVNSPVPWILFAIAVGLLLKKRATAPTLIPFATFSAMIFLAILPVNTDFPRYTLPLLPGVVLLAASATGLLVAKTGAIFRLSTLGLICAAMFATSWPKIRSGMPMPNKPAEARLALMQDRDISQKRLLIPHDDLPMLHYYFPKARFKTYYEEAAIEPEVHTGVIDGVIYRDPLRLVLVCPAKSAPAVKPSSVEACAQSEDFR